MSNAKPKGKGGRPSLYKTEYALQAEKLCKLGSTDKDMADFFGVAESTVNLWKLEHEEFSESIKRGKILADANVADKLYQRAMGYSHKAEKVFQHQGQIVRADTVEHYPPDTTACIFWLKNRQPEQWRETSSGDEALKEGLAALLQSGRKRAAETKTQSLH